MDFKLKTWQKYIVEELDKFQKDVKTEDIISLSNLDRNKKFAMQMNLPQDSGQTAMSVYLACHYPTTLIYFDLDDHFHEMETIAKYFNWSWHPNTKKVSFYEFQYVLQKCFEEHNAFNEHKNHLIEKLEDVDILVVDRYSKIKSNMFKQFILNYSEGMIVLLG